MSNILVSIVLPVYNGEKYLSESIDSIIAQTYQNWELIIIDDCSNDKSSEIAKSYAAIDDRIKYYRNKKNLKLPRSLNKGFSLANGDYFSWTSDDNYYFPIAIQEMVNKAVDNNSKYVIASSIVIDAEGNHVEDWIAPIDAYERSIGECVGNACFLYSRIVYEKIGDYDPKAILCEDYDYWQRICMNYRPTVITEPLYAYRWHSASLTSTLKQVEICKNIKLMLLRNVSGYGKLNYRQKHYFYKELARCNIILNEKSILVIMKHMYYSCIYTFFYDLPKRIARKLK